MEAYMFIYSEVHSCAKPLHTPRLQHTCTYTHTGSMMRKGDSPGDSNTGAK